VTEKPRASRFETLGSWLGLWTPPRDVVVPPVPWRKVAAGAGVLVVLGVFTGLVIAPAIDSAKDESAAEERAAEARRAAARRAAQREEQRARTGSLPGGGSRRAALAPVEAAIGADSADRFDTDGRPAACETAAGVDAAARRVVYDCFVTVRELRGAGQQEGARGALAIPYRAVLDFGARRYAFCKINPRPGEQAIGGPEDIVELPAACRR
jgi:hypothetical protein